jgi:hypothetical protein
MPAHPHPTPTLHFPGDLGGLMPAIPRSGGAWAACRCLARSFCPLCPGSGAAQARVDA